MITSNAIDSLRKMIRNSVQVLAFARTGRRRRAQYAARRVDARSARDSSSERRSRSREGREARGAIEQREQRGGLVEHFRHEFSGGDDWHRLEISQRSIHHGVVFAVQAWTTGHRARMTQIHTSKFETSVGNRKIQHSAPLNPPAQRIIQQPRLAPREGRTHR